MGDGGVELFEQEEQRSPVGTLAAVNVSYSLRYQEMSLEVIRRLGCGTV